MSAITIEITLANGAVVVANITEYSYVRKSGMREFTWSSPVNAKRRLKHVSVDEIVAIVEVTR